MTKEEITQLQNNLLIMLLAPFIGQEEMDRILAALKKEVELKKETESKSIEDEVVNGLMSKDELQKLINDLRYVEKEMFDTANNHGIDLSRINVYTVLNDVIQDLLTYMFGAKATVEILKVVYGANPISLDELYNIINKSE